jgi:hypothetical protein
MGSKLGYQVQELMVVINDGQRGSETRPALPPTNPALIVRAVKQIATMRLMPVLQLRAQAPRLLLLLLPNEARQRTTAGRIVDQ